MTTIQHKGAFIREESGRFYVFSDIDCTDESCVHVCGSLERAIEWVEFQ